MESLKIVLLCVTTAIVYGIGHDQVTARICVEYFTVGHPPIFGGTQDPTLLAFGWGVFATWWVGVMLGLPAAVLARVGSRPKLGWGDLRIPLGLLMGVVALTALFGGIVGFITGGFVANASWFFEHGIRGNRVLAFTAASGAHEAAYSTCFFGGVMIWGWIWWRRGRDQRQLNTANLARLRCERAEWVGD